MFSPLRPWAGRGRGSYGYPGFLPSSFPYPGFFDLGFLDPFWDDAEPFVYDQAPYRGAQDFDSYDIYAGSVPDEGTTYPQQSPDSGVSPYASPDGTRTEAQPGDEDPHGPLVYAPYTYAPYAYAPQSEGTAGSAPASEEDALILFFRDGRPPEQIRNYALTRTTLLVTDGRLREISLSELNIPLTQRVNRALGIDFQLPAAP